MPGQKLLLSLGGAGSMALGLTYVVHAFGPTEAQVLLWGWMSTCLGWAVIALAASAWRSNSRIIKLVASLGWGSVALLQIPPTVLWFAFHGSGISDGTPPSTFVAHWAYSIPHLVVLAASVAMVLNLLARPACGSHPRQPDASDSRGMTG